MNIIDALVVTFGIDASEYQKKQKEITASLTKMGEVSGKQTKLIAESGKKAAGAFSALKIEVLGALAAFGMGAGFKAFIESSMNSQAAAGRTADALGVSVQSMRAYSLMAREMGESGDAAVGTLQKVAAGLAAARRGDTTFLTNANKYGAGITLNDNVETTMSKLNKMAYAIKQKYGEQQAIGVLGELGVSDQLQAIRLTENPAKYAQERAEAMRKVGVWTPQQIAQNEKLQKQWADFLQDMDNLKIKIANEIEPALIKLGNQFEKWVDSGGLDRLTKKLEKLFDKLQKIVDALGGVKGILIEIAAIKVFGWAANIAGTILQLRALTVALRAAKAASVASVVPAGGVPGAAVPGAVAATGGFWTKLLGAGGVFGLFRAAAFAPRPDDASVDAAKKQMRQLAGSHESYWQKWSDVFHGASPTDSIPAKASRAAKPTNSAQSFAGLESQYGLPKGMLDSVFNAESSRGKNLISPKGALGPFQFMPATAAQYGLQGSDVFDKGKSSAAAARYLHDLIAKFHGNVPEALAAYNWGQGNVQRLGMGALPKETRDYITKVLGGMAGPYVGARSASAGSSTTTNQVHIGKIDVQTKAADSDAPGIAKAMRKALRDNPLIAGSVTALA